MPHFPKPFFRPKKNRWYVQLDGRHINLGADEEQAWAKYHDLMARRAKGEAVIPARAVGAPLVVIVLDHYLDWLRHRVEEGNKAERTWQWYRDYLQSFTGFATADYAISTLTADQLQPFHVYHWVDSHPEWKGSKRGAMIAVQRAFNWAAKAGLLKGIGGKSPLGTLEKPGQGRREVLLSPDEFRQLLARVPDQEFSDLLTVAWETGARPNELMTVEARHVDLDNARWVFPVRQSKGKKHQRVVYLTDRALEVTRRLTQMHPEGPLFRNTEGMPWSRFSVNCRFDRLRLAVGRQRMGENGAAIVRIRRLTAAERRDAQRVAEHRQAVLQHRKERRIAARKHGPRYSLYAIRHSWCTRALESGNLDAVTVSVLMGHRDTQMISRVYSHLTQHPDHLRNAARKVSGA